MWVKLTGWDVPKGNVFDSSAKNIPLSEDIFCNNNFELISLSETRDSYQRMLFFSMQLNTVIENWCRIWLAIRGYAIWYICEN